MSVAFLEPCDDREYIEYYRAYEGVKILDNGLIEFGKAITSTRLMDYARAVRADFIIPPDIIGDWTYNFASASEFAATQRFSKRFLLPCLAGPYARDFFYQAVAIENQYFGGMCLPFRTNRIAVRVVEGSRLHMLGLKWPEEYQSYLQLNPKAKLSLDTTEFISAAYYGKIYRTEGFATNKRPKNYKDMELTPREVGKAIDNMNWLQEQMTLHEDKPR